MRCAAPLGLVTLAALAGCFHPEEAPPPGETEIAIFPDILLSNSSREVAFEILSPVAYFRTDLSAPVQVNVRYNATAPGGGTHEGRNEPQWPFRPELRVTDPALGRWDLVVSAGRVSDGTLRILVPAG